MTSRILATLLISGLAAAACGEPPPPPRRAAAPVAPPKPLEEAVEQKEEQALYVYSPVGKRDPFQNVFAIAKVNPAQRAGLKPTPLQKWPLDALKLSMTVTGTSTPMGMVVDPQGRGWPVYIGTFVGQNWGKVSAIQRDQIVVTETITDHATGRVYPNNITIKVPRDDVEKASDEALRDGAQAQRGGSGD